HLDERIEILHVALQLVELLPPPARAGVLACHRSGAFGGIPEAGCTHLGLERRDALAQRSGVKDSPRAASSARGSRPGAQESTRWERWWPRLHAISDVSDSPPATASLCSQRCRPTPPRVSPKHSLRRSTPVTL